MADPVLIGPRPVSTPADLASSRPKKRDLPEDILRAASARLGVISLLAGVLWVLGVVLGHVAQRAIAPGSDQWMELGSTEVIGAIAVLVSLALYFYTKRSKRDPRFMLDLGLAYMIFISLALAVMVHWEPPHPGYMITPMIGWAGVVVIMFAAIVPTTPVKTFVASLIAVSMNPVSMLIAGARIHWTFGSPSDALLMHYPDYLLVGVAVVICLVVTRLGQQVIKARELGSYHLGELLGRGGMGEVYKATHRMLARPAAIKLIRPEMLGAADDEAAKLAVTRFRREAEAAAHLRSAHTVELYDFGVTADGTLYLVMEFLEGMDLESLVRSRGPLPPGRVIHILRQVCDSLDEAHSLGLVHRDIKPANIHVGRVGRQHDFVKVLDFGLVKAVADVNADNDSLATIPGQMALGTPAYMSPEMALGEPVDGRADIYAVGCVAYYLLTGQLVFEAEKAFQMIAKHLQSDPVPPSARIERAIPPALERLVLKCLAKNKTDRPQSASELSNALSFIPAEAWGEAQAMGWWQENGALPPVSVLPGMGYSPSPITALQGT